MRAPRDQLWEPSWIAYEERRTCAPSFINRTVIPRQKLPPKTLTSNLDFSASINLVVELVVSGVGVPPTIPAHHTRPPYPPTMVS